MLSDSHTDANPPACYAVIFSSQRTDADAAEYAEMAEAMEQSAKLQPGFLSMESARSSDGFGITVSYWSSLEAISAWQKHAEHLVAQRLGRERWYASYSLRVAKVERAATFPKS